MSKRKHTEDTSVKTQPKKSKPGGHWSQGLLASIEDPEYFVKSDDLVNIIKDKYPKAKFHYLILPKENISSLKTLTSKHVPLLKHMEEVGLSIASDKEKEGSTFKLGYHAEPSMSRLHLHVISDDMNSDCLKSKKHWNSFTSEFFISSQDIQKNLEKNGKIVLPSKEECKKYINSPLQCHKCDVKPKNMPELKKHILIHLK